MRRVQRFGSARCAVAILFALGGAWAAGARQSGVGQVMGRPDSVDGYLVAEFSSVQATGAETATERTTVRWRGTLALGSDGTYRLDRGRFVVNGAVSATSPLGRASSAISHDLSAPDADVLTLAIAPTSGPGAARIGIRVPALVDRTLVRVDGAVVQDQTRAERYLSAESPAAAGAVERRADGGFSADVASDWTQPVPGGAERVRVSAHFGAIRPAASDCVVNSLTAKPPVVCLLPGTGQRMSEQVTFTAKCPKTVTFISWDGDQGIDPQQTDFTLTTRYDSAGKKEVQAYPICRGMEGQMKSTTVIVVDVKYQDAFGNPIDSAKVGIPTKAHPEDRWKTLRAEINPPDNPNGFSVKPGPGVRVRDISQSNNIIRFDVTGDTASQNPGDRYVVVTHGKTECQRLPVTVVVPRMVVTPLDTGDGKSLKRMNVLLNRGTSPSAPNVPNSQFLRASYYWKWLTVAVADQFGDPVGDPELYGGSDISERFNAGGNISINQKLQSNSTYQDPVGIYVLAPPGRPVPRSGPDATGWSGQPIIPLAPQVINDNFTVFVDGFQLQPNIQRTVTAVPPDSVTIQ